jgi:hypothetical protein
LLVIVPESVTTSGLCFSMYRLIRDVLAARWLASRCASSMMMHAGLMASIIISVSPTLSSECVMM